MHALYMGLTCARFTLDSTYKKDSLLTIRRSLLVQISWSSSNTKRQEKEHWNACCGPPVRLRSENRLWCPSCLSSRTVVVCKSQKPVVAVPCELIPTWLDHTHIHMRFAKQAMNVCQRTPKPYKYMYIINDVRSWRLFSLFLYSSMTLILFHRVHVSYKEFTRDHFLPQRKRPLAY